jgi:NAD(P)-dependent dehydrogenase (short-subunit alcohol dehydrogenase family)
MNKTAIITGATRGLGREICLSFANRGFNVIGTYASDEGSAAEIRTQLETTGMKYRILSTTPAPGFNQLQCTVCSGRTFAIRSKSD